MLYAISESEQENAIFNLTLDENDEIACANIKKLFVDGVTGGGRPDNKTCENAAICYKQLGSLGHARALVNVGWLYHQGLAGLELASQIERDLEAVRFYKEAIKRNHPIAMYNLGCLYCDGRAGTELADQSERDKVGAEWFREAAKQDRGTAYERLGMLYEGGRIGLELPNQAERDKEAVSHFEEAAQLGIASAMYWLGYLYMNGRAGLEFSSQMVRDHEAIRYFITTLQLEDSISDTIFNLDYICRSNEKILLEAKIAIAQSYRKFLNYPDPIGNEARTALQHLANRNPQHPGIQYYAAFLLPEDLRYQTIIGLIPEDPSCILDCLLTDNSLDPIEKNAYFDNIAASFLPQLSLHQQNKLVLKDYLLANNNNSFFTLFPRDLRKLPASMAIPGLKSDPSPKIR